MDRDMSCSFKNMLRLVSLQLDNNVIAVVREEIIYYELNVAMRTHTVWKGLFFLDSRKYLTRIITPYTFKVFKPPQSTPTCSLFNVSEQSGKHEMLASMGQQLASNVKRLNGIHKIATVWICQRNTTYSSCMPYRRTTRRVRWY